MQFGVAESLVHWARYRPDAVAVSDQTGFTSYRHLNELSVVFAEALRAPCETHDRVAVAFRRKLHLIAAIFAVLKVGKSVVILNPSLEEKDLRTNIADTKVSAFIHDADNAHIARLFPENAVLVSLQPHTAYEHSNPSLRLYTTATRHPHEEWGIIFSSGTTGTPKGVERNHESIIVELLGWCLELNLNRATSFYVGRPIYYTGGLVLALSTLLTGGAVVLDDVEDDGDFDSVWHRYQTALAHHSIDYAFFIPEQIRRFCVLAEKHPPVALARTVLTMGASISDTEKLFAEKTLHSQIVESWGNSESLGTITEPADLHKRPKSIGRPFLGDRLLIVDDDCNELPPGQIGRIAGGEEAGFACYSSRPAETQQVKRNALIISEDLGYQDEDGYFYLKGRIQEHVIVDGVSVFLGDVERRVVASDAALEACVIASDLPDGTVCFCAMVVLAAASDVESVRTVLKALLPSRGASLKLLTVDCLPHLPSGKIDRAGVTKAFA